MKITIWSLYHYEPTLFDGLTLPAGIDFEILRDNIVLKCGEFGALYPDPDFLKQCITLWGKTNYLVWEKLYKTTQLDYDPISNYDRIEDTERTATGNAVNKETSFNSYKLQDTSGSTSDGNEKVHSVIKGNIGTMTAQQMIQEEREVDRFNIYDEIANDFKLHFCIETY